MTPKPVVPRATAVRDVDEVLDHYLSEGELQAARSARCFIDGLEAAYAHIAKYPASGPSRCAWELDLPGLRSWPLRHYPHLIFYRERDDHIDVWRVLHGRRDVAAWMHE